MKKTTGHDEKAAALLGAHYPVEFPAELFSLWKLCATLNPRQPRYALGEGFTLAGPFDLLAGRLKKNQKPKVPLVMHWRFYLDPPEFFTIATGDTDGLHWGYWFDAPGQTAPVVCSYYTNDAYEIIVRGETLREAVFLFLEDRIEDLKELMDDDPGEATSYRKELTGALAVQRRVKAWKWPASKPPRRTANIPTFGGMDLVVPRAKAAKLKSAKTLYQRADGGDGKTLLAEARSALAGGRLGLALQISRAVWTFSASKEWHPAAAALMADVYDALDRPVLAQITRVQARHRSISSVDLLS